MEIPKGIGPNDYIMIEGKGNQNIGQSLGYLSIGFKVAHHDIFKRKGADLYMKKTISITEAL